MSSRTKGYKTSNPILKEDVFEGFGFQDNAMTISGTVNKIYFLFAIVVVTFFMSWRYFSSSINYGNMYPVLIGGSIIGLVFAIVTTFNKKRANIFAPLYCVAEGIVLGAISLLFEKSYPGIVIQAIVLTFGILFVLLFIYKARIIKVTKNFKMAVFSATGAIGLVYLINMGARMFGRNIMPFIHEGGFAGIGFSLFVVVIASLNLVMDFDFIEKGEQNGAPKYMEWYAAFGLMVTLIWLYMEILRLLAKSRK